MILMDRILYFVKAIQIFLSCFFPYTGGDEETTGGGDEKITRRKRGMLLAAIIS